MINLNRECARTRRGVRRTTLLLLLGAAACISIGSVGCSSTSSTSQSLVKSINAYVPAPGTTEANGAVTMFANTTYLSAGLGFGMIGSSGGYVSLTSGTYNLYASLPGAQQPFAQNTNGTVFSGNNTPYTVIAAGENGQTGTFLPQIMVLPDYTNNPLTLSLASGQCAIRVVNVSLNPHPLGLYATAGGVPSSAIAPDTASVAFGYSAASNPYVAVTTSTLANMAIVDSTATATALPLTYDNNNNISDLNTNSFISGDAYTLVIYGVPGSPTAFNQLGCTWVQDYPVP